MRVRRQKALWVMKAAQDRRDEFYDSARKENIFGKETDKIGVVVRTSQRPY